jgi:ABC-2 type transport system ATP-binding protein
VIQISIVKVKNLRKVFEDKEDIVAVDNISFEIEEGEVFGLLGPNGAGKTTTLSMLATLVKPTSGTAEINGFDILKESHEVRKSIGIVFQNPSSDDLLTGYENLELHGLLYGLSKDSREKRIKNVLDLVDMSGRQNDLVKKYSGGMRRRVELARGLLHDPKILFLDEPTLGLDPQTREHIWNYIERLVKEKKVTVILTTHYMDEADRLCDRVAIIDFGKIVVLETPEKLKRDLGGEIIRLKIKKPNLQKVKKLKYVENISRLNDTVSLTVRDANRHLQEILKVIGKVESVESRSRTLNDVFLHYTGREFREEGAEGGFWERIADYRSKR